jgi:diguanylate cyclase (GGDEF)-like protein
MGPRARIASFLCRDEHERQWMLDMHHRLPPITRISGVISLATAAAIIPWASPLAFLPIVVGSIAMGVAIGSVTRTADVRPIFAAVLLLQAAIAVAIVINGRAGVGDLFLLVASIVPSAGGFPGRLVTALAIFSALLMALVGFVTGAALASPPTLILPLSMLLSVTLLSTAIRSASIDHRRAAATDALTGTGNRTSLVARSTELYDRASATGEPIALVVADVDRFKLVNDLYGHQTGDRVLVALAQVLRTSVEGRGDVFRMGGDEFVLVLPGLEAEQAASIAEEILATVRAEPLADVPVSLSVGVAASARGSGFPFERVFTAADTALYRAKSAGRDAVHVASGDLVIA